MTGALDQDSSAQQGEHETLMLFDRAWGSKVCYLHDALRQVPGVHTTSSKVVIHLTSALRVVRGCLRSHRYSVHEYKYASGGDSCPIVIMPQNAVADTIMLAYAGYSCLDTFDMAQQLAIYR